MALLISEAEVGELLTMADALRLVEEVFASGGRDAPATQPRRRVAGGRGTLNVMSASVPGRDVFGLKAYPTSPGGVTFTVLLWRASTSELLAIVEAGRLGALRTGAASGVATRYMARPDARTLGLFGAGTQAETQLEAVAAVRQLDLVRVHGRNAEGARAFCVRMAERTGLRVEPASAAREAAECDIVTTATSAVTPVLEGALLWPGAHVNAIGSNFASKAEVDLETVRRASRVVVDSLESARIEGGDLLPAIDRGVLAWEWVAELRDVVAGRTPGREGAEEIMLFTSHGVASEDVVLAHEAYERARARGMGTYVGMFGG